MNDTPVMNREPSNKSSRPAKTSKTNSTEQSPGANAAGQSVSSNPPVRQETTERRENPSRPQGNSAAETSRSGNGSSNSTNQTKTNTSQETVFQFDDSSAKEVFLVGSFTQWDKSPIRMSREGKSSWKAKAKLPRGRHLYKFLVDGNWKDDPKARNSCPNSFGTCDSVIEVE
jgi:5'-AMP-activated protein kinase regulatory beta subunit